jgi:hypothetical protein
MIKIWQGDCNYVVKWLLGLRTVPYYGYGRTIYGIYGPTLKLRRYGTGIRYGYTAVFTDKLPLTQNCSSKSHYFVLKSSLNVNIVQNSYCN